MLLASWPCQCSLVRRRQVCREGRNCTTSGSILSGYRHGRLDSPQWRAGHIAKGLCAVGLRTCLFRHGAEYLVETRLIIRRSTAPAPKNNSALAGLD